MSREDYTVAGKPPFSAHPHSDEKQLERRGHQQGCDSNDDADDAQSRLLLGGRDDSQQDPQGREDERNKKDADDAADDAADSKCAALPLHHGPTLLLSTLPLRSVIRHANLSFPNSARTHPSRQLLLCP